MTTLAGILCIRNGTGLDYCWEEAGRSLLGVCDELVICDSDSDDGTRQRMDEWAARETRINLVNFPWTDPRGTNLFWPEWVNYARQHAKSKWIVALDADEILHENSYAEVRDAANQGRALICHRFNFWRDAQHLIPHGHCCGHEVVRVGPQNIIMPSDYPIPGSDVIMAMAVPSKVEIMHYGFLRKREAFFKKARAIQRIWCDSYDPRLESAEDDPTPWMENHKVSEWINDLIPFEKTHPEIIKPWLRERGYDPK